MRTDTGIYWEPKFVSQIRCNFTKNNDLKKVRERNNKFDKFQNLIIFNRHSTHNMYLINSYNDTMDSNYLIYAYNNRIDKSNTMGLLSISKHIWEKSKISKIS